MFLQAVIIISVICPKIPDGLNASILWAASMKLAYLPLQHISATPYTYGPWLWRVEAEKLEDTAVIFLIIFLSFLLVFLLLFPCTCHLQQIRKWKGL